MIDQQALKMMQRIGVLFFRRLHDDLNIAEQIELDEWLNRQNPSSRQFLEEMTEWEEIHAALQDMYSYDMDAAFEDIQKKILGLSTLTVQTPTKLPLGRVRTIRWLAAATIVILSVSVVILYTKQKPREISIAPLSQRYKNDVAPGGEKAILELNDGSKIALDSALNGELANQGLTQIVKLKDGQLSYRANKAADMVVGYNAITTPRGGEYQVILPDGTKVWLNAASSLRFPTAFTGATRTVELDGEAYFQVAKNNNIPFTVEVGQGVSKKMNVWVLGTEFNIMAYKDETAIKTSLINGAIKVKSLTSELPVKPGQQAVLNKNSKRDDDLRLVSINVDEAVSWRKGLFQFHDASINDIMRQAARWYDVNVIFEDRVDQQFVGTIPRSVNISTLLKILESTGRVHFKVDGKAITVLK